ncbi:hypothetical protein SAY86_026760 [Trapa natans]|uniref:Pentatricopeptide repeat-containing protein n=1 Tax=Trapa natans TaxID=22666 RepID=A0AAN7KM35_TRANT|nr:hypothetical protein SAY86_026760 [Trapa natans]
MQLTTAPLSMANVLERQPDLLDRISVLVDQLKGCCSRRELQSVFASMIKISADQDCFSMNQFISRCSSMSQSDLADSALAQIEEPNVFVYNAMIRGSVQCSRPLQALEQYRSMSRADVRPTSYTFSSLIKGCGLAKALRFGESVHGGIWKSGFNWHVFVQTALIEFYASFGGVAESRKVWDEIQDGERDVFSWTTMISAYASAGDMLSARRLFDGMHERNTATWNALIDGYARSGDSISARSLFECMPVKDIISWTTMIACYTQEQRYQEAVAMFKGMIASGLIPDEVTMSTIISACAHLGSLDIGREIHYYIMQNQFQLDVFIGSSLIDMYSKCGSLERSLMVFYKLRERNLFCWNSLIEGLAVHGLAKGALLMFSKMESEKMNPNWITFVSILNACTHAGLVNEGQRWFMRMKEDYRITPRVEHYGCMVDLFSRAGLLEDALGLIRSMEFEPNAFIWGSLLGGCRVHRNLEIARVCGDALMSLEPNNTGHHMLLVNMYAENNRWGEVVNIRRTMKGNGVEKEFPGQSWIEIGGETCQFAASDGNHAVSDQLFFFLKKLDAQIRLSNIDMHSICTNY